MAGYNAQRLIGWRILAFKFLISTNLAAADTGNTENDSERDPDAETVTILISPKWQAEPAEHTPASVQLITAESLQQTGTDDTLALQYQVPGFIMKTNAILGQPYLRGIGSDIISAGTEPTVATFLDGFYLPRAAQSLQQLYDIDRIEVLKGPHGVHLGRNVVGGAVSILTLDPLPYRTATVQQIFGNYDRLQTRVSYNEPLQQADAALRVTGLIGKRDGYVHNDFLDTDVDDEDLRAWRLKYLYTPGQDFEISISSHGIRNKGSPNTGWSPDPAIPGSGALAIGGTSPPDTFQVNHDQAQEQLLTQALHGLRITKRWHAVELISATSIQHSDGVASLDQDGTELTYVSNDAQDSTEVYTQELRLRSADRDATWHWVGGVFALYEDAAQVIDIGLPLAFASNRTAGNVKTFSWAGFGELGWHPDPYWTLSGGLRYTRDRRELDLQQVIDDPAGALGPAGTTIITQQEQDSWGRLTPELTLSFKPDSLTFFWGRLASGFKSGGYNTSAPQPAFEPEKLLAVEVGVKTRLPRFHLYSELSLFHYDYRDMQLRTPPADAPIGTFPIVINAARSTVRGVDINTRYRPQGGFSALLGMTLLDARFDDFVSVDPNRPDLDPDHTGGRLPQAPDLSLNLHLDYAWHQAALGRFAVSARYRYQSEVYYNIYQDPATRQGGFGLLSAGLSWRPHRSNWQLRLFGNNLTDKHYWKGIVRQDPLVGTLRNPGDPRTFGIELRYDY